MKLRRATYLIIIILVFSTCIHSADFPEKYNPIREYSGQTIFDFEDVLEENIDIGLWSLIIAKEYDSSINVEAYLHTLDTMSARIQYMVGPREGDMVKFMMTKMYQFDPGEWNSGNVFSYDLDDPLGENSRNKLLSTYMGTKKGNCVSMPILFLALMERVDSNIPFHGVSVPIHLFCRLHERETGKIWNVEPTSGGHSNRDVWYIEGMNVPQFAIDSGTYMADMTK